MAPSSRKKTTDPIVARILDGLQAYKRKHARAAIEAYRRNPGSVRIRIIDPSFAGKDEIQREEAVWGFIDRLPEDVRLDISMLVLVTPDEVDDSLANREFESPTPSLL
jgi:stress-induced morphogen